MADDDSEAEFTGMDSFILDILRGWRLLVAAGLTDSERRDILASTQNRTDFQSVADALRSLYDDDSKTQNTQPQRSRWGGSGHSGGHMNMMDQDND